MAVRLAKDKLQEYDATILPQTKEMDIEKGNYIIPDEVSRATRVEIEALFKDEWEGKVSIPFSDWREIDQDIKVKLTDEAIISRIAP